MGNKAARQLQPGGKDEGKRSGAPAKKQACVGVCFEPPRSLFLTRLVPQLIILHSDENSDKKCFYACDPDPEKACSDACKLLCTEMNLPMCKRTCGRGCTVMPKDKIEK
eukprot:tig00020610_g12043.t1